MDFLTASNKKGLGDKVELFDKGILNAEGKMLSIEGVIRYGLCKNIS